VVKKAYLAPSLTAVQEHIKKVSETIKMGAALAAVRLDGTCHVYLKQYGELAAPGYKAEMRLTMPAPRV
jgi:hypothetical protein